MCIHYTQSCEQKKLGTRRLLSKRSKNSKNVFFKYLVSNEQMCSTVLQVPVFEHQTKKYKELNTRAESA